MKPKSFNNKPFNKKSLNKKSFTKKPFSKPVTLYTIGYATKPISTFIEQLQYYRIDVVADIRSVPFSKRFHDYHQHAIAKWLPEHGIRYVYLGEELGPRSKEATHYDTEGQVQFDRLMESELFRQGIQRLYTGLERNFRIALMCAEKDPATCHRSLLVGHYLIRQSQADENLQLLHITHDGDTETQQQLETRLTEIHSITMDLFTSAEEQAAQAYQLQLKKTSYRKTE